MQRPSSRMPRFKFSGHQKSEAKIPGVVFFGPEIPELVHDNEFKKKVSKQHLCRLTVFYILISPFYLEILMMSAMNTGNDFVEILKKTNSSENLI